MGGRASVRLLPICLGLLLLVGANSTVLAANQRATALRQTNNLTVFTPPEKFLTSIFVAEEMTPAYIFGPVKSFVSSRKRPTTCLIEEGAQNIPDKLCILGQPAEYTLYLEDCPNQAVYYVFIDQNGVAAQQKDRIPVPVPLPKQDRTGEWPHQIQTAAGLP
jgi:hypothetical protein